LTVDFVVCTLAVKKKIRAGFDMSDRTIPLLVLISVRGQVELRAIYKVILIFN
jgi:hypothetical protein